MLKFSNIIKFFSIEYYCCLLDFIMHSYFFKFFLFLFYYCSPNSVFLLNKFQKSIINLFQFVLGILKDSLSIKNYSFILIVPNLEFLNLFTRFDVIFGISLLYIIFVVLNRKILIISVINSYLEQGLYFRLVL